MLASTKIEGEMINFKLFKFLSYPAVVMLVCAGLVTGCAEQEGAGDRSAQASSEKPPQTGTTPNQEPAPGQINGARIIKADSEPGSWLAHGRTYDEQRFSPLKKINTQNVTELGLVWNYDFDTSRGLEATPIVVDGVMYVTGSWSKLYALDAKSGELIWHYDPKVPRGYSVNTCCGVVNRGVAIWEGKVYFGTLDGRLISVNAANGELFWETRTTPLDKPYSITGAPRIINGKVIIGNGGGELGVRGYFSAYDAKTGEMVWRFYTVPGNPDEPLEHPALEIAIKTWKGGEWWKMGGGGTAWDSMAYDPELDLLYVGVGNGSPWSRDQRSPGGGDNLFLSSIVAVRPETGEYVWHYQTTPGESWDYTATQHLILADLEIDGEPRKVIMQAPKNGFFFVIDRVSGEFISAENFVEVTWASHFDKKTGRPVEHPDARYGFDNPFVSTPSPFGAHNWQPMSYSPKTGLVYIPAMNSSFPYQIEQDFEHQTVGLNLGLNPDAYAMPSNQELRDEIRESISGELIAWDPVQQKEVWAVAHPISWNGGTLSTAGDIVFQGNAEGNFVAYDAKDGSKLWSFDGQNGIIAPPISYRIDNEQYVTVLAGWGGTIPLVAGETVKKAAKHNISRILTFKLGGTKKLPPHNVVEKTLDPPPFTGDEAQVVRGKTLYQRNCFACHGDTVVGGGVIADLRYASRETHEIWEDIVLGGAYSGLGMGSFADALSSRDAEDIRQYVIKRAHESLQSANE